MNTQRHKSSSLNQSNNYETTSTATAFSAADENLHSKPARLQAPGLVLLAGLAVAALAFSTTLFPWVQAHVNGVLGEQNLDITGSRAAPAVSALAMVALAAPLAARIAPQLLRYVIALVSIGSGVGIIFSALSVVMNPADAVVTETSKVTGTVASTGAYDVTVWPWISCISGFLIMCVGLWTLVVARHWQGGRKYDRTVSNMQEAPGEVDNMDAWDLLSRGEDPTVEK